MKLSKTLATVAVAGALTIAGLSAATLVGGYERANASPAGWSGDSPHGKKMCKRGKHGHHGAKGAHHKGPRDLATRLSVMETEIGIRADQLDDWRDFSDALQATMKPPFKGHSAPGKTVESTPQKPFSLAEGFANRAIERGTEAEKLKEAIAKLQTTLSPEQLEKVQVIEERFRTRMARHHGPRHGKHGKHGYKSHHGAKGGAEAPMAVPDKAAPDGDPSATDTDS